MATRGASAAGEVLGLSVLDKSSGGPVYRQIAESIAAAISAGRLGHGDRLPTHRALALQIGVAVPTVSRAYREVERRGLITSTVGRGTFVTGLPSHRADSPPVNLAVNGPARGEHEALLRSALAAAATDPRTAELLGYEADTGGLADRQAAAQWLAMTGAHVDPDTVAITHGGQHGILVTLGSALRPGDVLLTEALTYPGAQSAAEFLGVRVVGVEMDERGIIPEALAAACAAGEPRPRALYCMPTAHNPTAITMDLPRREALVAIARSHNLQIIEDDVFGMVVPDEGRPPPLIALAPERTLHVTSLSKALAPGLRWGAVAGPPELMARIGGSIRSTVFNPAPITVDLARRWLQDGSALRLALWQRQEMAARFAAVRELLGGCPAVRAIRTAGLHAWIELNAPWTAVEVVALARGLDIEIGPTTYFHANPGTDVSPGSESPGVRAIRLCVGNAPDRPALAGALAALAAALDGTPTIASGTRV